MYYTVNPNHSFRHRNDSSVEQLYPTWSGIGWSVRPTVRHHCHPLFFPKPSADGGHRTSKPSEKTQEPRGVASMSMRTTFLRSCSLCTDSSGIATTRTGSTFIISLHLRASHHPAGLATASAWSAPCLGPLIAIGLVSSSSYLPGAPHRMVRSRPHAACFFRCPSLCLVFSALSSGSHLVGGPLHQEVE
ncbi:hypothetical protein NPIL_410981 [Nephila pilipes]|uniref:Uncharacterized protein n=1 Tax=Nephila pilipes TaxID=299642 RepID=A0A8X6MEL4_NEPPI|nr:hypothetical protein NPIL_410981 [Nephila pilipes]